jgi:hypothetical protein
MLSCQLCQLFDVNFSGFVIFSIVVFMAQEIRVPVGDALKINQIEKW